MRCWYDNETGKKLLNKKKKRKNYREKNHETKSKIYNNTKKYEICIFLPHTHTHTCIQCIVLIEKTKTNNLQINLYSICII